MSGHTLPTFAPFSSLLTSRSLSHHNLSRKAQGSSSRSSTVLSFWITPRTHTWTQTIFTLVKVR